MIRPEADGAVAGAVQTMLAPPATPPPGQPCSVAAHHWRVGRGSAVSASSGTSGGRDPMRLP